MVSQVHKPSGGISSNTGSVAHLVDYLEKEKDSQLGFYSSEGDNIPSWSVIEDIDNNHAQLGKEDSKFYMLSLNPSQEELENVIGRSVSSKEELTIEEKQTIEGYLKELTKEAMDAYALNFGRDSVSSSDDLLYFARIETTRIYKPTHENISQGVRIGSEKPGLNYHVHIIVSRKSKDGKVKLSPNVASRGNDWELGDKVVRRGFDHERWKMEVQKSWDKITGTHSEASSYIKRDDTITRCTNADLQRLMEYRFSSAHLVIDEMKKMGYFVKYEGDSITFQRRNKVRGRMKKEQFCISLRDLRIRETRFKPEEKASMWYKLKENRGLKQEVKYQKTVRAFSTAEKMHQTTIKTNVPSSYYSNYHEAEYKEGDQDKHIGYNADYLRNTPEGYSENNLESLKPQKEQVVKEYICDVEEKTLMSYNECLYAYKRVCGYDEIIDSLPNAELKCLFQDWQICSASERIKQIEKNGYTYKFDREHCFTKGHITVRLSHREMSVLNKVEPSRLLDVSSRLNVKMANTLKEHYIPEDGIHIEKSQYQDKEGKTQEVYLVVDEKSKTIARLSDVLKAKKEHSWDFEEFMSSIPKGDIRTVFRDWQVCSFSERIKQIESLGYTYKFDRGHCFTKGGETIRIAHTDLVETSKVEPSRLLDVASRLNVKMANTLKEHYIPEDGIHIEKSQYQDKEGKTQAVYLVVDEKSKTIAKLSDVLKTKKELSWDFEEFMSSIPDGEIRSVFRDWQVCSFSERIKQIESLGYTYTFDKGHCFTKDGNTIRIAHKDLAKTSKVDSTDIFTLSSRIDLKSAYALKENYRSCDGVHIEKRTYITKTGEEKHSYVVVDSRQKIVVKLSDVYKHHREQRNAIKAVKGSDAMGIGKGELGGRLKQSLIQHTALRELAPVISTAQTAKSLAMLATNPLGAVKSQLISQVKSIVLAAVKSV